MRTLIEYKSDIFDVQPSRKHEMSAATARLENKIKLRWLAEDRVEATATQWVGSVDVPGVGPLRVVPKLAGSELDVLAMIAVAEGSSPDVLNSLENLHSPGKADSLPELLARFLTDAANDVHRQGLLSGYRSTQDDLPYMRGRLDVREQALRKFGALDTLSCNYEEFDTDILENRVTAAALGVARRLTSNAQRRTATGRVYEDFVGSAPTPPPSPEVVRRTLQYDRRNERYRTALTWSLAILENSFLDDMFDVGHTRAQAFLVDMNWLFECFVTTLVQQSLPGGFVAKPQATDSSVFKSDSGSFTIRPDILISGGLRSCAIDAKYKRYDGNSLSPNDLYQLTTYAQAYPGWGPVPRSMLIYPSMGSEAPRTIRFQPGGRLLAEVHVHPLPIRGIIAALSGGDQIPLANFEQSLRSWLTAGAYIKSS